MSDTAAEMLKDRLNDMERNAYDGIDFRQDVTAAYALADELGNERDQLKAENAMLRKLVREAHSCKTDEGCCEDCYCDEGCCPIERRMQELGIEVDG